MIDITWGPEILVGGVRPAWLGDDVRGLFENEPNRWLEEDRLTEWSWGQEANGGKGCPIHIRLPADHFAYVAIAKGYTPWGGGDAAPDDWDQGDVLRRGGNGKTHRPEPYIASYNVNQRWSHISYHGPFDIIGYRKRIETPADTVTIARMTEAQLFTLPDGKGDSVNPHYAAGFRDAYRELGLIRPETIAGRFTRETGHEATKAVLAALAFDRD